MNIIFNILLTISLLPVVVQAMDAEQNNPSSLQSPIVQIMHDSPSHWHELSSQEKCIAKSCALCAAAGVTCFCLSNTYIISSLSSSTDKPVTMSSDLLASVIIAGLSPLVTIIGAGCYGAYDPKCSWWCGKPQKDDYDV